VQQTQLNSLRINNNITECVLCIRSLSIDRNDVTANTVKTAVSFRHLLRHRNSASASVISSHKSVCLRVKTTLRLSYRVFEMTLLSALIKSHSKVSKKHAKYIISNTR
jgi:hypothetical protein